MSIWGDLEEMLGDIARHTSETGDTVIPADEGGFIQFIAYNPNAKEGEDDFSCQWALPLGSLRPGLARIEERDPLKGRLLREAFNSGKGREQLCKSFPKPSPGAPPNRFNRKEPL